MTRLGDLERTAMEAVWAADRPLTAREVAARAGGSLAYTTWLTVLSRLERKGLLVRSRDARAHTYSPVGTREGHVAELMRQALGAADDREAALQHFARSVTPDEAAALRAALTPDALAAPAPEALAPAAPDAGPDPAHDAHHGRD